jgi:uncharacterized phage-associated protein
VVSTLADAHDVAAAILDQTGRVTTMKLQKLVYYAQAWQLVFHGRPLFRDRIEAWSEGPVTRVLNDAHRRRYSVDSWPRGDARNLTPEEAETVSWVLDQYSRFSAESLSRMTHLDSPWRTTRGMLPEGARSDAEIPLDAIRSFYSRQRSDPDVAVAQAAASAALEGVELDTDWQQVLRDVAHGNRSAADAVQAEIDRTRRV